MMTVLAGTMDLASASVSVLRAAEEIEVVVCADILIYPLVRLKIRISIWVRWPLVAAGGFVLLFDLIILYRNIVSNTLIIL
jgi:hypothetical protein